MKKKSIIVLSIWLPESFKKMLFPDLKESTYKEPVALLRKFQYDVLKPEALKQYIPVMDSFARGQLQFEWRLNSVVKVVPLIRKHIFDVSIRLFLNVVDRESANKLFDAFDRMSTTIVSQSLDLPFNRSKRAGKLARAELMRIVKERRMELATATASEEERSDLLSKTIVSVDEDGRSASDGGIVNFFVGLLLASYESTASALIAVVYFLAQLPHIYEEVFKEQMAIAESKRPDEVLTWEDVEKMKYSWNVARESLRLAPPAQGGFREATTEFSYAGFTIPQGWKTFWTPHSSHMNPDYFPEPEKFDPSRFEGSGPQPYTYIPFGGGPKMCPGRGIAKLQILVLMHNLVTRFRLEKAIPTEKMVFLDKFMPSHGLSVRLHPHKK